MNKIDVSKCEYKGGIECHIRDYPILNCADVKIEDCHYKQLQQLKAERDLLLGQLVILNGEYVTVQITQEQFEEYNKLKAENEELKEKLKEVQKFLEQHEVGECDWDDDCYYCKNESKDGEYFCYIGNALEVIRGKKQ